MKISVVIPTFNRQEHILIALESVYSQTLKPDEIIVIDDGSTDNTKELLSSHPIVYLYQKNLGVSSARNLGINCAKNNWIAFLDSDDTWEKNKLEQHSNFHIKHPTIEASFTDELWIRNNKKVKLKTHQKKERATFLNSLRLCKIGASTFFSHKNLFKKHGLFDETFIACEDYDMWLRILLHDSIGYIDEKLTVKYAGHKNQLSFTTKQIDQFRILALEKHLESSYKQEVLTELEYKTAILSKGAFKHQNSELIEFCTQRYNYYKSLK